jgi:hypothetical protein
MTTAPQQPGAVAPKRRAAFVFIFITILFDMMALGLIIPILPKLIAGRTAAYAGGRKLSTERVG